ncbi:ABC transporter A family member 11 [Cryptomeria japonica]|uniref:ABC transporter A family member 11 n=1 Tax=Cryptomeria japonica TaxID=3369 RepID=UPI0027D9E986|nr:ABC transporter A family member 11 [Cryptomeria japonica]
MENHQSIELRKGFGLFRQQFAELMKKNALLSWRNKPALFLQLFSSFFFVFLVFCSQEAIKSRFKDSTSFKNVFDPENKVVEGIPKCEDGYFIKTPCYDFLWSGSNSSVISEIVTNIMARNPERPIPSSKVKGFVSPAEVDQWLEANPMYCPGALHFHQKNSTVISYGIQTNSTAKQKRGYSEEPTLKFQIPLQVAAEREIARYLIGESSFSWTVGLKEFAHPATESFSTVGSIGPTFFLAAALFGFVIQLGSILAEKELKLRQAMSIMGLYDSVYWLTWLTWEGLLTLLSAILLIIFGMIFQFYFFLNNSFEILFLMFFLFQFNMIGFAFMLSTFISKSSSATSVGFSVYIIGFITQLVTTFGFPYSNTYSKNLRTIWSIFPPNLFSKGLALLGDATSTKQDEGISWSSRSKCPSIDDECVITVDDIFKWLTATFFVWFILAIYFDNVLPDVNGVRKSWFYFINPSYWTGKGSNRVEGGGFCSCTGSIPPLSESSPDDEDVAEEESVVKRQATENTSDPSVAVQVRGLVKTFPGIRNMSGCFKCKKVAPYHAVKGLWINFEKDKLFCLLGPNGAGKTTTINCLTGITPITAGDALCYGYSIKTTTGMSQIRNLMGVCPQFDILWDALSAQEHLYLFASIKGMPRSAIKSDAENLLSKVKLSEAAGLQVGSYSGGMKRRLSVAIALVGDPKLVFLDEPTTGMDPITRRHVWDIIEDAKKGRAIILTTHSMEEADILSDRIAIMARGKLRCIGTSVRLKSRFGAGYIVHVSLHEESKNNLQNVNNSLQGKGNGPQYEKLKHFFKERLNIEPKEENKAYITFIIPREKEEQLTDFFAELENREEELGISDIQLSLATLEEVFLNIAMQAEIEAAAAESRFATLNLLSGSSIQVPIGARFVVIPGTESPTNPGGLMVEVYWQQDDTCALCISGYSDEMPVPQDLANAEILTSSLRNRSRRSFGRLSFRNPVPIGLVIDADKSSASNRSH